MAVIEDVSDVVRSNRLAAWAEMARIIAHEIKNPLTPIRLAVEHLREVWRRGDPEFGRVLEECVSRVLKQTEELRQSASEFSDYARLPAPEVEPTDVSRLLAESAAAYAGVPGIAWSLDIEPGSARAGGRAPAVAGLLEPDRQRGGGSRRREGRDPDHGAAAGLPRLRERRGHRVRAWIRRT